VKKAYRKGSGAKFRRTSAIGAQENRTIELAVLSWSEQLVSLQAHVSCGFIRNKNTRRAYLEAVRQFSAFCAVHGIEDLAQVEPVHVAAFVEDQLREHSKPTVKQRLAALRMLFDWMVVGQVLAVNPAHAVRGPKHTQRKGKTPVLNVDEARTLIDAIDITSLPVLRSGADCSDGLHLRPRGSCGRDAG